MKKKYHFSILFIIIILFVNKNHFRTNSFQHKENRRNLATDDFQDSKITTHWGTLIKIWRRWCKSYIVQVARYTRLVRYISGMNSIYVTNPEVFRKTSIPRSSWHEVIYSSHFYRLNPTTMITYIIRIRVPLTKSWKRIRLGKTSLARLVCLQCLITTILSYR